ncbi:putative N6-adenine-specific DNA methylase [Acetobacter estunensis NRIC 0472]|uniref:Class I SAM-dependent RNA methyltransferase n=1 Tax=Acetobacter estunensis TaxID=104097 RepID=A0A967B7Y3_9PROT|nr:THUMP domain-containing protein [Acetobacter estunensis]NHO54034.1 class I SAM-dependent RNA methyltransferase [Acetobacter estunensis]GBQ24077.1 putative N6-adenine-specific DNA methylase [Acetobacter estunensis NRIC 0472]
MTKSADFEIFLATNPGLEAVLCDEVRYKGFKRPVAVPGGVITHGGWPEVWRANLWVRGATRVLARIASFRVTHLAQLDQLARQVPWSHVLRADVPFRVEAVSVGSRLYHEKAVAQRIGTAIHETLGAPQSPDAEIVVRARLERNVCTLSVDTSGEMLHRRGHKQAVNRAPLRETMASLFLRQCSFTGEEPVLDPMCGSGTFVIEAAEIAARLNPGRSRHFAFEQLATFDAQAWEKMRGVQSARTPVVRFYGSDRDAGAIRMSRDNAERAGVASWTEFVERTISEITPPEGPPGLVITNAPYGNRIGDRKRLMPLYRALGQVLLARFGGWRAGVVTTERHLAEATGLPFLAPEAPVPHGGLRVTLFRTAPLPR